MSNAASFQLATALCGALALAACNAGVSGNPGGPGPGASGSAGTTGSGGGTGNTPEGGLPSPVCEAGSVVPSFHRLNRLEYQNSVNQLLGTDLPIADDLPVDSLVYGFDNNAAVSMSATVMQKYLNAAQSAVSAALASQSTRAALIPCALTEASCARSVLEKFITQAYLPRRRLDREQGARLLHGLSVAGHRQGARAVQEQAVDRDGLGQRSGCGR